ncbi:FAD-dependent oxidoreductase [Luteimonas sp. MC1825]|uniref:NAD(P)/FAD-dependent oxidoreductase n=1 Tax=Luteimonas sp. MC1825 TaxID=2761107 RepID=UPI00160DBECC|nr:FAD-dependent oxidoreductase [Luteimonas sp. MC1825]MBB6598755.1 FAD-dependent oxidoreductase [Luteimonas sp. MC1825]QOC88916.1 FAD-dependent oxidoreductase [Luteimonas sp. MC1825]
MGERVDVVVVGGGVIGLCTALCLVEAGRSVRVLEAGSVGSGSSHGNCGTLTPSHAGPLAAPGTIAKAVRWMLTPDAPFYVAPRFDPGLWRWLFGFARRCNARDWRSAMASRATLLNASRAAFPDWVARHAPDAEFAEEGADCVFRTQADFDRVAAEMPALHALGIAAEAVPGAAYLRANPAFRDGLFAAIRYPGDARLRPDRYVSGLAASLRGLGGVIDEGFKVDGVVREADGVRVRGSGGDVLAGDVVFATGAWTPTLVKSAGLAALPMQPGKGYSITYTRPRLVPQRPVILHERSVCVTVWDSGFRLGSTMEFSGYDSTLNRRRLDALERGAAEYLHEPFGAVKQEEWCGWRPLSVDDVPIIGRVPGQAHVWVATGHGMLGVSMSPATGQLLADLVCGRSPRIDPAPYSPARFP